MPKKKCRRCQQIRMVAILLSMIAILLLMMMGKSQAEIYKYTDDSGKRVYVGSLSQVPQKYKTQIQLQTPSDEVNNTGRFSEKNKKVSASIKVRSEIRRLERMLAQMETPVKIQKNQVLIPVSVTYHGKEAKVHMLMDTGASGTVFHRDALARLDAMSEAAGYARVAGGGVIKVSSIEFDRIKVGPFKAKNIRSFVIDNKSPGGKFDGLLGMDFLMNVKYEVDFDRKVIIWDPIRYKAMEVLLKEAQSTP
ncbi:retropepsin-like aspartic protease family protein [Neptunomonas japonica]|nr:retropepsin-like aspartic protease [Neptunomonas japonica]